MHCFLEMRLAMYAMGQSEDTMRSHGIHHHSGATSLKIYIKQNIAIAAIEPDIPSYKPLGVK
jgi:hypothetical protein